MKPGEGSDLLKYFVLVSIQDSIIVLVEYCGTSVVTCSLPLTICSITCLKSVLKIFILFILYSEFSNFFFFFSSGIYLLLFFFSFFFLFVVDFVIH